MLTPKTPTFIVNSHDLPLVLFYGVLSALAVSGVGNESRWAARRLALQMDTCGNTMHCKSTDVLGVNYAELHHPEAFIWLNGRQVCV